MLLQQTTPLPPTVTPAGPTVPPLAGTVVPPIDGAIATVETWLLAAAIIGFLAAMAVAVWIFYDSSRKAAPATLAKGAATFLAVCGVPGLVLALAEMAGFHLLSDTRIVQAMVWLAVGAGLVSLMTGVIYVLTIGRSEPAWQGDDGEWGWPDNQADGGAGFDGASTAVRSEQSPIGGMAEAIPGVMTVQETVVIRTGGGRGLMAWLVVLGGPHNGREIPLTANMVIGRDAGKCDFVLEDETVSGMHARIRHIDGAFVIQDMGSANGTFVNGEPIDKRTLADRDRVRLGTAELILVWVTPDRPESRIVGESIPPAAGETVG